MDASSIGPLIQIAIAIAVFMILMSLYKTYAKGN